MPIDPRELRRSAARLGLTNPDSTPCRHCGYDLVGLPMGGICPECGQVQTSTDGITIRGNDPWPCGGCGSALVGLKPGDPCPNCGRIIRSRLRKVFSSQHFLESPRSYMHSVALAGVLLMGGWMGMATGMVVRGVSDPSAGAALFICAAVVWWAGVFIITRPRPIQPSEHADPRTEWIVPRILARLTQASWVVAGGAAAAAGNAPPSAALGSVMTLAFLAGAIGLVALFIVLSNLTYWASDSGSSESYRTMIWIMPIAAVLMPIFCESGLNSIGQLLPKYFLFAGVIILGAAAFVIAPQVWMVYTLFNLHRLGRWGAINQEAHQERERFFRERAEAAAQLGPGPGSGVDPVDLPAFNLGSSEVDVPPEQRTLRRAGAGLVRRNRPKPEPPPKLNLPFE